MRQHVVVALQEESEEHTIHIRWLMECDEVELTEHWNPPTLVEESPLRTKYVEPVLGAIKSTLTAHGQVLHYDISDKNNLGTWSQAELISEVERLRKIEDAAADLILNNPPARQAYLDALAQAFE